MADKKPFVNYSGKLAEISTGDKIPIANLATGTPTGTKFIRDDGTLAVPAGGGSFTLTEVEIDFGTIPVTEKSFTITNGSITNTNLIVVSPSGNAATDRVGNDYSWETFSFSTTPGTGNFELWANCSNGSVVGKRKILYTYS